MLALLFHGLTEPVDPLLPDLEVVGVGASQLPQSHAQPLVELVFDGLLLECELDLSEEVGFLTQIELFEEGLKQLQLSLQKR